MKKKPLAKKAVSRKTTAPKKAPRVRQIGSNSEEGVVAPSTDIPRHLRGQDLSTTRRGTLRELSWMQFDGLVQTLAQQVLADFRPDAVVGVAHGGVFAGGALANALGAEFFPVRISKRSRDHASRPVPKMHGQMPRELKGRQVLIVDDVAASGETLELALVKAQAVKAKTVKTLALVTKEMGFAPDFSGWVTDDFVVFPWDYEDVTEDSRFDVDPDSAGA